MEKLSIVMKTFEDVGNSLSLAIDFDSIQVC